jgi:UDP-N-acetylglucosamine:LPS N-acetylglucosamine transferase
MAAAEAAVLLEQSEANPPALAERIETLLTNPAGLADISRAALTRAHPDAADRIAAKALGILSDRAL